MELRLTREQIDVMSRHAEDAYPEECCGLILGPPAGPPSNEAARNGREEVRLFPVRNVQNEYHERDPETYTRTARRAYLIDPFEFERILGEAKESGEVLRGIFHSHPDEDAYFSQEDKDVAVPFGDIPSFPDAEHVVMSVRERRVRDFKVFRWSTEEKDFAGGELAVDGEI
ncbi:MAG: M67 family metallopeptidase [Nitrospinota bacterium]|nr:M67 family metallopeptidase [Nitrospinota bacterium]MDP7663807.1 M67 family metallopeptidase [Nitrospinota bacterium]